MRAMQSFTFFFLCGFGIRRALRRACARSVRSMFISRTQAIHKERKSSNDFCRSSSACHALPGGSAPSVWSSRAAKPCCVLCASLLSCVFPTLLLLPARAWVHGCAHVEVATAPLLHASASLVVLKRHAFAACVLQRLSATCVVSLHTAWKSKRAIPREAGGTFNISYSHFQIQFLFTCLLPSLLPQYQTFSFVHSFHTLWQRWHWQAIVPEQ